MTYKKNIEKTDRLLHFWRLGNTVSHTAIITRIPSSTVGYYFCKFNKQPDKYKKIVNGKFQEPLKKDIRSAALISIDWMERKAIVDPLIRQGKYIEARDYLQMVLLYNDFNEKYFRQISNVDHHELISTAIKIYQENEFYKSVLDKIIKTESQLHWKKLKETAKKLMLTPEFTDSDRKYFKNYMENMDKIMENITSDNTKGYYNNDIKKLKESIVMMQQNSSVPVDKKLKTT